MTPNEHHNAQWRMASAEAALDRRTFMTIGLPPPNVVVFQEYGEKDTDSEGGQLVRGKCQVQMAWENMTPRQAATLRAEIEAGVTAGYLWLTVDRASGHAPGPDWVDIKGKPYLPDWATVAKTYNQVYGQLALRLLAVEVINSPSGEPA